MVSEPLLFTNIFYNSFTNNAIVYNILDSKKLRILNLQMFKDYLTNNNNSATHQEIINVCDKTSINEQYVIEVLTKLVANVGNKRDGLFIFSTTTNKLVGFLALLKGECGISAYNSSVALQLICSNLPGAPIGSILVSAYLIASNMKNHEFAILEVAGGYENKEALCLYDKFGFVSDIDIKDDTCFPDDNTIPMIAELKKITNSKILKTLNRTTGGIQSQDAFCSITDPVTLQKSKNRRTYTADYIYNTKKAIRNNELMIPRHITRSNTAASNLYLQNDIVLRNQLDTAKAYLIKSREESF